MRELLFSLPGVWLQFAVCVALIGVAGSSLSRYGDVIAEKTGLSGSWVGVVLLATVTSLPELITGVSSVALAHAPNIAVGNVLGACVMNLFMIVVLDFLYRGESVYTRASHGHILAAGFSVILIGFVGFNILLATHGAVISLGYVGLYSPMIVLLYAVALRTVFRYEQRHMTEFAEEKAARYPDVSLRTAYARYGMAATVVVVAALWLPFVGTALAEVMGWRATFVGTLFVAFATTIPEMVVTLSAMRLGALDMAIGNLFGSNLFNVVILAIDDLFYLPGPLLSHVSDLHAVSAVSAMIMTGTAVVGLFYRPKTRLFKTIGWASLFLFGIYILNAYILYLYGH